MRSQANQITVKPEVEFIESLLDQIAEGRLRVPRFQRPFVWRPEQMRNLFDSIERGYPVGTLLLWDTNKAYRSLDTMGALKLPRPPSGTVSYLLDGHQRLSTLYSVLMLPADHPRQQDDDTWKWWIYRNLLVQEQDDATDKKNTKARFDHVRRGTPPTTYLPLRALLRTTDFLNFARSLEEKLSKESHSNKEIDRLIRRAEDVANRIKNYKIGLTRVVGGDLDQAVEIFSRLNSSGQKMLPDQMVAALTYREDKEGGFNLAEKLDELQEALANRLKFGEIPRDVVFRAVLTATGQSDIQRTDWSRLAKHIDEDVPKSINAARRALVKTVRFLRSEIGVSHIRLVPYTAQLVHLAVFYLECPTPNDRQRKTLIRWFWSTSFSGWYAGANTTRYKNMLESMRGFARGTIKVKELRGLNEQALPYPTRFDLQSARVRTLLLWQIKTRPPLACNGRPLKVHQELALHETRAWRHILSTQLQKSNFRSDPVNRILLPPHKEKSVRQTLVDLDPDNPDQAAILESHFISPEAHRALVDEDYEEFAQYRADALINGERDFIMRLRLEPAERERSEPNVDTEGSGG